MVYMIYIYTCHQYQPVVTQDSVTEDVPTCRFDPFCWVFSSSPDGICITCQLRGQLDGLRAELKGGGAMIETVRCVSKEGSE